MIFKKFAVISATILVLLALGQCKGDHDHNADGNTDMDAAKTTVSHRIDREKEWLTGKRLASLESSISAGSANQVVLIISANDCRSCIGTSIETANLIFKKYQEAAQIIYSSSIRNIDDFKTLYEPLFEYGVAFSPDTDQLIMRELRYFSTPAFIFLDSNKTVIDSYYPTRGDDDYYKQAFLESLALAENY